jgi:hypothetical protein
VDRWLNRARIDGAPVVGDLFFPEGFRDMPNTTQIGSPKDHQQVESNFNAKFRKLLLKRGLRINLYTHCVEPNPDPSEPESESSVAPASASTASSSTSFAPASSAPAVQVAEALLFSDHWGCTWILDYGFKDLRV